MTYFTLKALHVIAFTCWMAGMFYLPRLYVYHCRVAADSEAGLLFAEMERKLLRYIMNPAMILTLGLGIALVLQAPDWMKQGWLHAKLLLVLLMAGCHGFLAAARKKFAAGTNTRSEKFYRVLNEVPTVLFVGIALLAVIKPF